MMGRFIALPGILFMCFILAACAQTSLQAPAASVQYTLAVLPWKIVEANFTGGSPYDITMDAFQGALAKAPFVPVFSYYNLQESTTIKERPGIEGVWGGRSVTSDPNRQLVFQLGEQLDVDAAITYAVAEKFGTDYLSVYLFDIPSQKVYSSSGTISRFTEEASPILVGMTRRVFAKFLKHRVNM